MLSLKKNKACTTFWQSSNPLSYVHAINPPFNQDSSIHTCQDFSFPPSSLVQDDVVSLQSRVHLLVQIRGPKWINPARDSALITPSALQKRNRQIALLASSPVETIVKVRNQEKLKATRQQDIFERLSWMKWPYPENIKYILDPTSAQHAKL